MNRTLSALFAALEAVLVAAIGLVIPLVPLTILWGVQYGLGFDWAIVWRASADLWLLGNGTDLRIILPAELASQLALPNVAQAFFITIAPLGFALLAVLLGSRAGLRIADGAHPRVGLAAAFVTYIVISAGVVVIAINPIARPSVVQGLTLPPLVFLLGLAIGAVRSRGWAAVIARVRIADQWRRFIRLGFIGGFGSVALLMAVSAVVTAILLASRFSTVISLYESLQAGIVGGTILTLLQLMLLPNTVIWMASWLIGPGFALGTGSSVSPVGTQLGPLPALPIFGAIPPGHSVLGFLGLLVPVLTGFAIGLALRRSVGRLSADWTSRVPLRLALCTSIGAVAGLTAGILAAVSGGSAGPGRLVDVGPNPWLVGIAFLIEVAVPVGIALISRPGETAKL